MEAASGKHLKIAVVTPEMAVLDEIADFVAAPMFDGELGILPGRAPLIGRLGVGEMRIQQGGATKRFFVDGGFLQIRGDVVTLLTSRAVAVEVIDAKAAQAELQTLVARPTKSEHEQLDSMKAQQRARAMIRLASKI